MRIIKFTCKTNMVVTFVLSVLVIASSGWAATYYVDKNHPSASDSTAGTSPSAPWKTIQKGVDTATAGDIVYVKTGVYYESIDLKRSGTQGNVIMFQSYPDHDVVLDGSNTSDSKLVHWNATGSGKNYIVWDGIDVRNGKSKGFWIVGNNNTVKNCRIYNHGYTGLQALDVDHLTLSNNEIYDNGWNGLSVENGNYATIEHNIVRNNPDHGGIDIKPKEPSTVLQTGNNIRYNIIYGNKGGIYSRYQQDNEISNNLIYENDGGGGGIFLHYGGRRSKILNNTICGNNWRGLENSGATNLVIKNNIFFHNRVNISQSGHTVDYNLHYGEAYSGEGSNGIYADPKFLDSVNHDYAITSESRAIDAGDDHTSENIKYDLAGISVPQGNGIDIGAYEYNYNSPPLINDESNAPPTNASPAAPTSLRFIR